MATTLPLRQKETIEQLKVYFYQHKQFRNYALLVIGINIPLRISDLLRLRWKDVFDFKQGSFKKHLFLFEQKTRKSNMFFINDSAVQAFNILKSTNSTFDPDSFVFASSHNSCKPISRITAYLAIKKAANTLGLENISCHSLRKTFGYHAWKSGVHLALITSIYNHSSIEITKRYLGIEQDDKDNVFKNQNL